MQGNSGFVACVLVNSVVVDNLFGGLTRCKLFILFDFVIYIISKRIVIFMSR